MLSPTDASTESGNISQANFASDLLCKWFGNRRSEILLAFSDHNSIEALRDHCYNTHSLGDGFYGPKLQYIRPVIRTFIHAIANPPVHPLRTFTEDRLFESVLRPEDLAFCFAVLLSDHSALSRYESPHDMVALVEKYADREGCQWPQVIRFAEDQLQRIYGRGLPSLARRQYLDRYFRTLKRMKQKARMEPSSSFFVYLAGGAAFEELE
jgi:hypothetical protein